ncbi:hypothetical protein NVP1262O_06 [Vibrio phage 1.262.O._10N.286.51.A9]|nr:hypothetical protein NVP1262O_06 [Vibrio phage 1.262.O._10N.286.51.A9]
MTARVRPKRFGNNQNYIQRNKPRTAHDSAPLVWSTQPIIVVDSEDGLEKEALTENGLPLTDKGEILTDG